MDITKLKMVSQFWKNKSLILWSIYSGCFTRIKGNMRVEVLYNLTWLSTISSARTLLKSHPPPMRNEVFLPTIRRQGEVRVPSGTSAPSGCCHPTRSLSLGHLSAPPSHQSPCSWAVSIWRATGLSPNVGWWMKALPVFSHPPFPSSKSKLRATLKKKRRNFNTSSWILFDYHSVWIPLYSFVFDYLSCSIQQWILKDIYIEIFYQCIQLDMCRCWNMDCCCRESCLKQHDWVS